jgi:general stress protein 13
LSIDDEGKLNLSLKDNDYFKNYERKKEKQSVLDEIRETEKYGFQTLKERLPIWIKQSKRAIRNESKKLSFQTLCMIFGTIYLLL